LDWQENGKVCADGRGAVSLDFPELLCGAKVVSPGKTLDYGF
jgi:hypothetical protein